MCDMDDELEKAGRAYLAARDVSDRMHAELKDIVIKAYKQQIGTMHIARLTGLEREQVRRIRLAAEKAGVLPTEVDPRA